MPYKKSYTKKPKASSRYETYKNCGLQAAKDGAALYSLVKPFLPVNVEYKKKTIVDTLAPTATPNYTLLNGLTPGTLSWDRTGRSVRCTSLQYKILSTVNAVPVGTVVRVLFLWDMAPAEAAPLDSDYSHTATTPSSLRNQDYLQRFRTLKDITFKLSSDTPNHMLKGVIRIPRKWDTKYDGGVTGNIADISQGSFYCVVVTNGASAPSMERSFRINYIDN